MGRRWSSEVVFSAIKRVLGEDFPRDVVSIDFATGLR